MHPVITMARMARPPLCCWRMRYGKVVYGVIWRNIHCHGYPSEIRKLRAKSGRFHKRFRLKALRTIKSAYINRKKPAYVVINRRSGKSARATRRCAVGQSSGASSVGSGLSILAPFVRRCFTSEAMDRFQTIPLGSGF
jgi:hypothetical protein